MIHRGLSVLFCPLLTVGGQMQMPQTEKDLVTKGPYPSRMKVWITPPGKPPERQRCLGKGNGDWVVKGDSEYLVATPRQMQ